MSYDVARVRGLIASLGDGWIHLDPQHGMLVPDRVSTVISTAFRSSASSAAGRHSSARRSAQIVDSARQAVADLVGGAPEGVVLGASHAALLGWLAESTSSKLGLGTGLMLSRLDDEANVAPWLRVASRAGARVRWAEVDIETYEVPSWQFAELIGPTTRLAALTAGSAMIGSMPDVRAAAERIHEVDGLLVVDASAVAPYRYLDIQELEADVIAVSGPAWGGPPAGALVFRDPSLLDRLPSMSLNPRARGPERLEVGGHQYAMLAGLEASIDHLAGLDDRATGTRRARLEQSMTSLQSYHRDLLSYLTRSLAGVPDLAIFGRTQGPLPTLSFAVDGIPADKIAAHLAQHRVGVVHGLPSGGRFFDALGVTEIGGAVTMGLAPYTTRFEIDQFMDVLSGLDAAD